MELAEIRIGEDYAIGKTPAERVKVLGLKRPMVGRFTAAQVTMVRVSADGVEKLYRPEDIARPWWEEEALRRSRTATKRLEAAAARALEEALGRLPGLSGVPAIDLRLTVDLRLTATEVEAFNQLKGGYAL